MPGNLKQIKLNLALSLDSGSLAGMTYRLFNLLQHLAHHSMDEVDGFERANHEVILPA
jgi:hypothetical protein